MCTFWEKLGGKVVERSCFWRACVEEIEAVPLIDGILCFCYCFDDLLCCNN